MVPTLTDDQIVARVIVGKIARTGRRSDKVLRKELGISSDKLRKIKYANNLSRKINRVYAAKKITDADVAKLRADQATGTFTYKALGAKYNISSVMAWKICNGWRKQETTH